MVMPRSIFQTCKPRPDVEAGTTKDEQFAADLAQVIKGTAPDAYRVPAVFFQNSYPTRGMKDLLKAVCLRLSGQGGEVSSVLRLDTQYGGGKTHGLIALVHAVRGMKGVEDIAEFIDPALVPSGKVRVAALDGENSDPANGLTLEGDLRAFSFWGDLAYQLAGADGYRRVEAGDRKHVAPGAETLRELFGGEPTLIMMDEVSVYLRKVERVHPGAGDQFTAFLQALIKAVESSPGAALVFTLAVGKDSEARDAYKEEHERAMAILAEAGKVAARKATILNPTAEDETADVLRRRLFASVDPAAADAVAAYADTWARNASSLPAGINTPELKEQFRRGYPLHPETLAVLTEKVSSLSNFQRIRGMVRLLARTVQVLWRDKPADAFAIHPHHIDPGFEPIRDELTTRLEQREYTPALKSDVAAVAGDDPSVAQKLDQQFYPGGLPFASYVARTIFLNTLAHGDAAKGITPEHLRFSVCSPAVEPSFVEQACQRFIAESLFRDDRPGAPLRLMVEPNLNQMIRKQMEEIDSKEIRSQLHERIRSLFGKAGGKFNLALFPAGPYEVPDEVGEGRPFLVVMGYEALSISSDPRGVPGDILAIFRHKGAANNFRDYPNNLVFVVADERHCQNMKDRVCRHLALRELLKPDRIRLLADHQQRTVKEESARAPFEVSQAVLHCYRHLFYPSHNRMEGSPEPIAHAVLEIPRAGDRPGEGEGQAVIARALRDQKKLLDEGDPPDAPTFVRDQTPLKTRGEISTLALRNEFRRAPKLSILLSESPLIECIRKGIDAGLFIYREGNQLWGKGDPEPAVRLNDNSFVHTIDDARKKKLWPRPEPLTVRLSASPVAIKPGGAALLTAWVDGGASPYTFSSPEPKLNLAGTAQTSLAISVAPESTTSYQVEVVDSGGQKQAASVLVRVEAGDGAGQGNDTSPGGVGGAATVEEGKRTTSHDTLTAEGPLAQALTELWEKARKARHRSLEKLVIRFYEAPATWQVHQALATMTREAQVSCRFDTSITADGVETFQIVFEGRFDRANTIKSFLDPQLRTARESNFEATYTLGFPSGLALSPGAPEAFAKNLTRYGSGEAYVEAHAAAQEVPV